jgi:hypothetical protein
MQGVGGSSPLILTIEEPAKTLGFGGFFHFLFISENAPKRSTKGQQKVNKRSTEGQQGSTEWGRFSSIFLAESEKKQWQVSQKTRRTER